MLTISWCLKSRIRELRKRKERRLNKVKWDLALREYRLMENEPCRCRSLVMLDRRISSFAHLVCRGAPRLWPGRRSHIQIHVRGNEFAMRQSVVSRTVYLRVILYFVQSLLDKSNNFASWRCGRWCARAVSWAFCVWPKRRMWRVRNNKKKKGRKMQGSSASAVYVILEIALAASYRGFFSYI